MEQFALASQFTIYLCYYLIQTLKSMLILSRINYVIL